MSEISLVILCHPSDTYTIFKKLGHTEASKALKAFSTFAAAHCTNIHLKRMKTAPHVFFIK